jgi:23S rRNA pseudouridine1911/1915/1917 synthase
LSAEHKVLRLEVAEVGSSGCRVDTFIAESLRLFTRSQVRRRISEVRLNGKAVRLSKRVHNGDSVEISYTDAPDTKVEPEAIPLDILYEDTNVLVLSKPQGMVVHPAAGNWSGTLVNALLHHSSGLAGSFPAGAARAGIVHRLDKDTSGVIITAKNPEVLEFLARQFRLRRVGKQYLAVVHGALPQTRGIVENRIGRDPRNRKRFTCLDGPGGGKVAVTRYRELGRVGENSLVSLRPRTGRTHQLRVHMAYLGCPIVGDGLYGRNRSADPLMLHAYRLRLRLPGERRYRTFCAPLPERFRKYFRQSTGSRPGTG